MKNKKGFTLIELLAVIVILAIIALIATPMILNTIEKSRKNSAKDSVYGYVEAIESQNALANLTPEKYQEITSGDVTNINSKIKVKGSKPTSGTVTIEKGNVTAATVCVNGYTVTYDGKEVTDTTKGCGESNNNSSNNNQQADSSFGGTKVSPQSGETHKGIVYMNPTDLTVECNINNSQIGTGITNESGCMKFYIYDDSGNTYKMILDHNTTGTIAYDTSGDYKEYAQATIKEQVDIDTAGWVGNPRLITADEIATVTNTSSYNGSGARWFYLNGTGDKKQEKVSESQGDSVYAWLYDYTYGCIDYGCNVAESNIVVGYWTSTRDSETSPNGKYGAWVVNLEGIASGSSVEHNNIFGIRPVITVLKSDID